MNGDAAQARRLQAALREIFARHTGEAADSRMLRRVLALCEAARRAVDDVYRHERLHLVGEYAAELLSHKEHAKLPRNAVS